MREYEHLTLARLLLAQHHGTKADTVLEEALSFLRRLLTAAEEGGRGGSLIEVLLLRALAHQARGDLPAGLDALHGAVTLAEPEGYLRIFADEGPPMAALLKALIKRDGSHAYLGRLLAVTTRSRTPVPAQKDIVDALSDRELDVLRLLGTDLAGPDIARELSVSLNTMRTHTRNIYAKLGVSSRRTAVRRAHDLSLLPGPHRS